MAARLDRTLQRDPFETTLRLFFVVVGYYLVSKLYFIRSTLFSVPEIPTPMLSWVPASVHTPFILACVGLCLASVACLIRSPWSRPLRIVAFVSFVIVFAHGSSFGKSHNDHFGITFAMLTLIFLPNADQPRDRAEQVLFLAKFSSVVCYPMAGLWKIRVQPLLYEQFGWDGVFGNLGNAIATEHFKYGYPVSAVSQFFIDHDLMTGAMFIGLFSLQALAPILVLFRRTQVPFGCAIVLFHAMSEVILNIPFRGQMLLIALFFIYDPIARPLPADKALP